MATRREREIALALMAGLRFKVCLRLGCTHVARRPAGLRGNWLCVCHVRGRNQKKPSLVRCNGTALDRPTNFAVKAVVV